jgi:hypothetical protein
MICMHAGRQVTPQKPVTSFAIRLAIDIYSDPRRIIETFPNNGTLVSTWDATGAQFSFFLTQPLPSHPAHMHALACHGPVNGHASMLAACCTHGSTCVHFACFSARSSCGGSRWSSCCKVAASATSPPSSCRVQAGTVGQE